MCDYSLEHVASRSAVAADRLISTNFNGTSTRGFAAAGALNTAVCLRPGTEIAFDSAPRYENPVTWAEEQASGTTARFRQVDMHIRHVHHDALEFADQHHRSGGAVDPGPMGDGAATAERAAAHSGGRLGDQRFGDQERRRHHGLTPQPLTLPGHSGTAR
jgi:hypothetical protein